MLIFMLGAGNNPSTIVGGEVIQVNSLCTHPLPLARIDGSASLSRAFTEPFGGGGGGGGGGS